MILNENEHKIMKNLERSSRGNGHDFGFIEDVTEVDGFTKHQVAGYLSDLSRKRFIEIYEKEQGYNVTQFTFTDEGFLYLGLDDEVGCH